MTNCESGEFFGAGTTSKSSIKDNNVKELLADLEFRLIDLFKSDLEKIILFGSYANGNYNNESDIDLIVLIKNTELNLFEDEIADIVVDMIGKYSIYPSLMLENKTLFYEIGDREALYKNIINEGIELFERDKSLIEFIDPTEEI